MHIIATYLKKINDDSAAVPEQAQEPPPADEALNE